MGSEGWNQSPGAYGATSIQAKPNTSLQPPFKAGTTKRFLGDRERANTQMFAKSKWYMSGMCPEIRNWLFPQSLSLPKPGMPVSTSPLPQQIQKSQFSSPRINLLVLWSMKRSRCSLELQRGSERVKPWTKSKKKQARKGSLLSIIVGFVFPIYRECCLATLALPTSSISPQHRPNKPDPHGTLLGTVGFTGESSGSMGFIFPFPALSVFSQVENTFQGS